MDRPGQRIDRRKIGQLLRIVAAIAATGLATAPTGCAVPEAPASSDSDPPAIPVRVAPIQTAALAAPIHAVGRIGYADETRLAFKVGGVVARVAVEEGARVRRGQLLARLDPREIDANLAQAESASTKAERDLARARSLHADRVVPEEALQNAATAADVARAGAAAARFNRRFSEIRAPADGSVLARLVEPGEIVAPGAPILVLGSSGPGRVVRVGLADRDVVRVAQGDPAEVTLDALPGRTLAGEVVELAPAASPRTGLFEVEVRLPEDAALASGLVARVVIAPRATERFVTVPVDALVEADGVRGHVFVVAADGRHVLRRQVEIAFLSGDRVALRGGLEGATSVVAQGAAYLDERSTVKVAAPASQP